MMGRITLACMLLTACTSSVTPPIVAPDAGEIADPVVLALVHEHLAVASKDPDSAELRGTLGLVYEANHIWPRAAEAFTDAATLDPDNPLWSFHAAKAYYRSGYSELADELIKTLIERFPDFSPGRFRHAVLLMDSGQIEAAQREFSLCTRLEPGFPEAWISEAEALVLLDQHDAALERVGRALEIDSRLQRALYVRGLALQGLGRMEEAARDLERGGDVPRYMMPDGLVPRVAQYAEGISVKSSHAMKLMAEGRHVEAVAFIEEAIRKRPDEVVFLNTQAMGYRRLQRPERSLEILLRANELEPGNLSTLSLAAVACSDMGDFARALEFSEEAVRVAPQNGRVRLGLARSLLALNRAEDARVALEETILLDPTLASARAFLAQSLTALGRHMDAENAWKTALESEPAMAAWVYHLGQTQIKLAKVDAAGQTLAKLRALKPQTAGTQELVKRLSRSLEELKGD